MLDILNLEPQKTPKDPTKYSMMVVGQSKIGKTTFVDDFFGKEKTLFLTTEDRHKVLSGSYIQRLSGYSDFLSVLQMLKNPKVKEKYDNIVIDTIDGLYEMCEKFTADRYDEVILGQGDKRKNISFSEDYRFVKSLIKNVEQISALGYNLILISHSVKTLKSVRYSELSDETKEFLLKNGYSLDTDKKGNVTYEVNETALPEKIEVWLKSKMDNVLLLDYAPDKMTRIIKTREDILNNIASSTWEGIKPILPLSAKAVKEEFNRLIQQKDESMLTDKHDNQVEILDFDEIMKEVKQLGQQLQEKGLMDKVKDISDKVFGEEVFMTQAKENQVELLKVCLDKMKVLNENTEGK